jgi:hypothetical protein
MKALLDTDILSEVLKSKDRQVLARASAYLAEHGRYTLSTITIMEGVSFVSSRVASFASMSPSLPAASGRMAFRIDGVRPTPS